jgi:hypothetical protein
MGQGLLNFIAINDEEVYAGLEVCHAIGFYRADHCLVAPFFQVVKIINSGFYAGSAKSLERGSSIPPPTRGCERVAHDNHSSIGLSSGTDHSFFPPPLLLTPHFLYLASPIRNAHYVSPPDTDNQSASRAPKTRPQPIHSMR